MFDSSEKISKSLAFNFRISRQTALGQEAEVWAFWHGDTKRTWRKTWSGSGGLGSEIGPGTFASGTQVQAYR